MIAGAVGKSGRSTKVSVEVAVSGEDVEFVGGFLFGVTTVWTGTGLGCCVFGGVVEGALGDAEVEVAGNQLDADEA